MAKVKVLVEGYAREAGEELFATSTATLIEENNINIIVDPGMDRKKLLSALKEADIETKDIDFVVLTHYHLDHSLLAGIFENAKILDNEEIYSLDGRIKSHEAVIPGTTVQIIQTPGHDMFHCSVVANTEVYGKVGIAGDVFWWMDEEQRKIDRESLIGHKDPYVKDESQLIESREKMMELCDYIIPGHGSMFRVEGK